ncbi:MAG: hypothetical protein LBR18_07125 [Tannerella sp.]|nr:hypothetical protein [Tannerella sp.]
MKHILLIMSILLMLVLFPVSCIYEQVVENNKGGGVVTPPDPEPTNPVLHLRIKPETELIQNFNAQVGLFITNSKDASILTPNFAVSLNGGGGSQSVDVELPAGSDSIVSYRVYYPYSSSSSVVNTSTNRYSGSIPSVQDQAIASDNSIPTSISDRLLMISTSANSVNIKDNNVPELRLQNVLSLVRVKIKANADLLSDPNFKTQRIKQVEIYYSMKGYPNTSLLNIAGDYGILLTRAPGDSYYTPPSPTTLSNATTKTTANITNSPLITATEQHVWFVIPPVNESNTFYDSFSMFAVITTQSDDNVTYKSVHEFSENGIGVTRNRLIDVATTLRKDNIVSDNVLKKNFRDEPANTYIISEAGFYSIPLSKNDGAPITGAASADWIWASGTQVVATSNIEDLISNITLKGDSITFNVGSVMSSLKKGNVLLAAKNSSGKILWTWHIWITDKPKDVTYESGKTFMDRNLGALSIESYGSYAEKYGFVYQWGRKDPFFGGDGVSASETATLSVAKTNTILRNTSWDWDVTPKGTVTGDVIDYTIENPTKFIYGDDNLGLAADWLATSDSTLWGGVSKTIYDPCPHGYRVPDKNDVATLHILAGINSNSQYFRMINNYSWEYYRQGGVKELWYVSGYRLGRSVSQGHSGGQLIASGTASESGSMAYWTRTPALQAGQPVPGGSYRVFSSNTQLYSSDDYGDNADAYAIRCVKTP